VKRIPRELAVTAADDPCNPVDGFFFIWTSMTKFECRYKGSMEKDKQGSQHGKREDEAMDGDGVVTMKAHGKEKKVMERFACKWAYGCKSS